MIFNDSPILFFDSASYLSIGQKIWTVLQIKLDALVDLSAASDSLGQHARFPLSSDGGLMGGRSYFYSAAIWGARAGQDYAFIIMAQSAWIAMVVLLALHRLGVSKSRQRLGVLAMLSVGTPLAFFSCTIMPDVFAGVAPLSVMLLLAFAHRMPLVEKVFWVGNLMASLLFHKAVFLLAAVLFLVAMFNRRQRDRRLLSNVVIVFFALIFGGILEIGTQRAAETVAGKPVINPPFLIARGLGDGTISSILAQDCSGSQSGRWVTCRLIDKLPMTENQFLWGPDGWLNMPPEIRGAIAQEQLPLVTAVLTRVPLKQALKTTENILVQAAYPHVLEFTMPRIAEQIARDAPDKAGNSRYLESRIAQGNFPAALMSRLWQIIYIFSIIASFSILFYFYRRKSNFLNPDVVRVLWFLLLSLGISAIITASIAGPFGRYQGRISWIATLVFSTLVINLLRSTGDVTSHRKVGTANADPPQDKPTDMAH